MLSVAVLTLLQCPVCRGRLNWQAPYLWCGNGRCTSEAADNGAAGDTQEEALQKLKENCEGEQASANISDLSRKETNATTER